MLQFFLVLGLGIISGFLIPIASGAGLFSLAGLLFLGLPPQVAIATNRMGGIGLWPPVIYKYAKAKMIVWKYVLPLCVLATVGAAIGAHIVIAIPERILKFAVSVLILIIVVLTLINKELGLVPRHVDSQSKKIGFIGFFISNIYGGFFGSGQGILADYFLLRYLGLTILESKATTAISTYCMIFSSLTVFLMKGVINLEVGAILAIGMCIGGWGGSHFSLLIGNKFLRIIFLISTGVMGIVFMYQSLKG